MIKDDGWIDASVPLYPGMVHWPTDPGFEAVPAKSFEKDRVRVTRLVLGSHTGTHVDAPRHFLADGPGVDRMPLQASLGRARVVMVDSAEQISADALVEVNPQPKERLVIKTRNSELWDRPHFDERFVRLSLAAAELLAERQVLLVGVDYLSVGGFRDPDGPAIHRTLLAAGTWIVEGLDLRQVPPGPCELICLPLKLLDGDGAPARALVRPD